jgi:anti-sigma factor RsiW
MLSCKEVCYIVSESLDGRLPLHKRIKVRLHLAMCKACQRMVRQMELLQAAVRRYGATEDKASTADHETLSEEACNRILSRLQQAKNEPPENE